MHRYPKNVIYEKNYCHMKFAELSFESFSPRFENFAAAGFYFSSGFVFCCSCSLKLRNWMKIRNPLIVHAILNPNCRFLLREKGPLFLHNLRENYVKDWDDETFTCSICYARSIENFVECGHTYCNSCLKKLDSCPLCKYPITYNATHSVGL